MEFQVIDLHSKLSEETRRADKAEFEVKTKAEKMKSLGAEKQVSEHGLKLVFTPWFFLPIIDFSEASFGERLAEGNERRTYGQRPTRGDRCLGGALWRYV